MIVTDNMIVAGIGTFQTYGEVHTTVDSKYLYIEVLPGGPAEGVLSEEDLEYLSQLGWHWSESLERWYIAI